MKNKIEIVCEKLYSNQEKVTLRSFLNPLDLHFEPEEFIEQNDIEISPKVISITVYLDWIPKLFTSDEMNDIFKKYIKPHSKITQDEYFMVEEYIHRYY